MSDIRMVSARAYEAQCRIVLRFQSKGGCGSEANLLHCRGWPTSRTEGQQCGTDAGESPIQCAIAAKKTPGLCGPGVRVCCHQQPSACRRGGTVPLRSSR